MRYLRDHWNGRHPLARAFWINLVAVRAVAIWLESLLEPLARKDPERTLTLYIPIAILSHVILLTWQLIGTVRSLDAFERDRGAMYAVWGTQLGIVLAVGASIVSVIVSVQPMLLDPPGEPLHKVWERERANKYDITLDANGHTLSIVGEIELGMAKALRRVFAERQDIRVVSLESPGGHIYEGRAVAKLIEQHGLDTFVAGACESACVTAFMGGRERVLGPGGKIGFHQYGDAAKYPTPLADLGNEQELDRAYFASRGVASPFLDKVFDAPHDAIWYPTQAELLAAGVVHRLRQTRE
ncbi:MAG: hypothetical protein ACFE0S_08360 [Rhodospirillales bacterium]